MTVVVKPEPVTDRPGKPIGAMTTSNFKEKKSKAEKVRKVVAMYLDQADDPCFEDFLWWLDEELG